MTPTGARLRARARFGSTALAADQCRDERGTAVIDTTIRDLQYAWRTFVRAPLTAFTIVVTVAVGLGVVAVLFTVLNALFFRVDNVPDISPMYEVQRPPQANGDQSPWTRPVWDAMRSGTSVFTDAYADVDGINLRVDGRMMAVTLVTGNFFQVVRVAPVMGRALTPADDARSGGYPVIVLSADFHNYGGIRPAMHPRWLRCSFLKYAQYSRSSRLASGAPRRPRCVTVIMKGST